MTTRKVTADPETADRMRGWCPPGTTLYTILGHVSKSGMTREIGVRAMFPEPRHTDPVTILDLDYNAAAMTGRRLGDNGVRVQGCGMDMGFELVYNLSHALYPDGFECIGEGCPANDHSNGSDVKHHTDGGYALRQRWL
jgi:hypothetical protein